MRRIVLALSIVMALQTFAVDASDDRANQEQMSAVLRGIDRMSRLGQCKEVNDLADRHILDDDATGNAIRFYVLDSLIPRPSGDHCPYHDRKMSLRLAINAFEYTARAEWNLGFDAGAWAWLEHALGPSWRERLAAAGVVPAVQELVAVHLYCVWKDGRRPVAFWDRLATDPHTGSRDRLADIVLEGQSDSLACTKLVGPAKPDIACFWNAVEIRLMSGSQDIVSSGLTRGLRADLGVLPGGQAFSEHVLKLAERTDNLHDPSFTVAVQAELRKLIAAICAGTMSPVAHRNAMRRAALMRFGSVDDVIDAFE